MHLRAIRIRGFKSFPQPVEVRLEPGVAVVVGPNGSGKSNVADALLWASGSLSPSELRAEKPDDVLFSGSGETRPADYCQVELVLDNEDGVLAELPYAEVSIMRRLHRGGEGQYLINATAVRRTDLVELLADIGLGGAAGSVISQGKVEEILASKPEERRALVEDAAGLGKFKRRRHRAELKLARVAQDVARARDVEVEVRKRLRPLALQATAAQRAEKLAGEIARLDAAVATLDLAAVDDQIAAAEERRTAADHAKRRSDAELDDLVTERRRAEEELADAAGRREQATAALYRLRSATERVALRQESAGELLQGLQDAAKRPRIPTGPSQAERRRQKLRDEAALARERLTALERALAEREGVPPAARALAERGYPLVLSDLDVPTGDERAVAASLRGRGAAVVAPDTETALSLVQEARRRGLGSVTVVVGRRPREAFAIVEETELLSAGGLAVTRDGIAFDPERGELWFAGEAAEAVLLELEARRRALADEIGELEREADSVADDPPPTPVVDDARYRPLIAAAERLAATLTAAAGAAAGCEPALRARADAGSTRTGELAEELRRLGGAEAEVRRQAAEISTRASAIEVDLARLRAERKEAERRLEACGAEPAEGDDRHVLLERAERLRRRREELGRVNPLAAEEYASEKEHLADLTGQREDLERSLDELAKLRDELDETVERRFAETFDAVSRNFEEVAQTLFPGGKGRLRLTGEQEGDDEDVAPGIEVELQPAGKRVTRLSLLSGGEKALGAISFLFALFLARPCPFYLLDEVEAALDDTNIGRFVQLLRRYADRAQFIVVTHQKKTMEAADVIYGVTMGVDGVSQIVSRRLPRDDEAEAAA
ncbi:MAG TPA: AAA family ATPase [Gaiellaceae bacterium]|nr:AAA family ATPase [Gaiellaceae bacterium]